MVSSRATDTPAARPEASLHSRGSRRGAAVGVVAAVGALVVLLSGCSSPAPVRSAGGEASDAASSASVRRDCTGVMGGVIVDQIEVPAGATCTLHGTTVTGDVSIGSGATFSARGVAVMGSIRGHGARQVVVSAGSSVRGDVQLQQGGFATLSRAEVHGDLHWSLQSGPLTIRQAVVGGDLQVSQNRGWSIIARSRVGGDLRCDRNSRRPTQGANVVAGRREGQCAPSWGPRTQARASTPRTAVAPRAPATKRRPPCAGDSVSDDPSDDSCGDD